MMVEAERSQKDSLADLADDVDLLICEIREICAK